MKKNILFLVLIMIGISGCDSLSKLTQFDIDFDSYTTIPKSGLNITPFNIATPPIQSNSESKFSANNTSVDLIEKVAIKKLTLTVSSPANGDLSFLKSIKVYIAADGMDDALLASKDNIPDNCGASIDLDVTAANFKEYITKDKFSLKVKAETDKLLAEDHEVDVHTVFLVDANILGL